MRIIMLTVALMGTLFITACNSCGPAPTSPSLAWGVLDKTTNTNTQHSDGDTMVIVPTDQYIVTLQVQDPDSIKEMDVSGMGNFTCSSTPDSNGQNFTAPNSLPASIPTQTTTIPNSGSTSGFVMSQPFVYFQLDCGKHQYANMSQAAEFFVGSGTLQIKGNETSWKGAQRSATLNLHP